MRNPFPPACDPVSRFDAEGLPGTHPPGRLVTLLDPYAALSPLAIGQVDEVAVWFESVLAELDRTADTH